MTLNQIERLLSYSPSEYITEPINADIRKINLHHKQFDQQKIKRFNRIIIDVVQLDYQLYRIISADQHGRSFYQKIFDDMEIEQIEKKITGKILRIKTMIRDFKKTQIS